MAMQFWEAKRKRRTRTLWYITLFCVLAVVVSYGFELAIRFLAKEGYTAPMPYLGIALFAFICVVAFFYYLSYLTSGGQAVAESMGGRRLELATASSKEAQLLNIVEEISIASRLPCPAVYLIKAKEINAFAAGLKPDKAIIAVTTGALDNLTREELQGVVAHEFGHIANEDMCIGMRLAAMLMGFFIVFYIGIRLLEGSLFFGGGRQRGNSVPIIALLLLLAGAFLWFAGAILRASVSRQREYLADASAVEFTRSSQGIASALKKIEKHNAAVQDMPKSGLAVSHLYFDNRRFLSRIFATHPPLEKRIAILEGKKE